MLNRLLHSSSYQVGTVFAVLMLLGILFVSYWLVIASDDTLLRESEEAVRAELRGLVNIQEAAGLEAMTAQLIQRLTERDDGYFYALRDRRGSLQAGNVPAWPPADVERLKEGLILFELDYDALPGVNRSPRPGSEHFDIMAKIHRFPGGEELLVGRNVDDLEIAQFVARSFGWVMILILVLIFALSYGVAYYVASRFDRIAATTDRIIETGNLAERLPVDSSWDDLSKLAALLNRMLAEIELRVDGIKSVSDSIAHDLRTPLMRLRTRIEESTAEPARSALLEELDRTLGVFQSLLRISAIEAGKQPLSLERVELDRVLRDAVELYEPLAGERGQRLLVESDPVSLRADRDLLFQAIANLIDNALKFTPSDEEIHCTVARDAADVTLTVADSGPGIPQDKRATVLQRFRRLDGSRSTPGNGLGLALVQAIVHRHGGSMQLQAAHPGEPPEGLQVTLSFPQDPESTPG